MDCKLATVFNTIDHGDKRGLFTAPRSIKDWVTSTPLAVYDIEIDQQFVPWR
jgi:hypothetical protein